MKKIISFVGLFAVLGVGIGDAHGVAMSAQVRRLLQEKQEKIEQLEKCEGKKQGWMIAGISTIGLTAVGVGVNIAQASKSNRLSSEIEMEKSALEKQQNELNRIQNDIAAERTRQSEANKCCDMKRRCCECEKLNNGNCPGDVDDDMTAYDYSKYKLDCDTVKFSFLKTGYADAVIRLNTECVRVTGENMVQTEDGDYIYFECKNYKEKANCDKDDKQDDEDFPTTVTCNDKDKVFTCAIAPISMGRCEKLGNICKQVLGGEWKSLPVYGSNGEVMIGASHFKCVNMEKCKENVPPAKPDQNCRTSYGKKPTTDCPCDGDKGLSSGTDGTCVCSDSNTKWNGQKCARDSVEPVPPITPIPPKPTEPEYDEIDLKNCRLSGGEWRYRDQYKRWECFCGINQSGSDKNMVQTSGFKTCACKKDYIWIDDNDHSKGCKRGISAAENADLNKITNLYGKFERVVNSMDTKAGQAGRAATAASGASKAADARKYADQAKNYFDEINTLYMEAGALYEEINALISGLSIELRSKVSTYIKDADTLNSRLESIVQKARSAASEAEKAAVALENLAAAGDTCKTVQCQKCVNTGGKWEELVDGTAFCRCDRKQGLVSDSSKMLYCKPAN